MKDHRSSIVIGVGLLLLLLWFGMARTVRKGTPQDDRMSTAISAGAIGTPSVAPPLAHG